MTTNNQKQGTVKFLKHKSEVLLKPQRASAVKGSNFEPIPSSSTYTCIVRKLTWLHF